MIIREEIDGRPASVQYLTRERKPTDATNAEMIRINFDDGNTAVAFANDAKAKEPNSDHAMDTVPTCKAWKDRRWSKPATIAADRAPTWRDCRWAPARDRDVLTEHMAMDRAISDGLPCTAALAYVRLAFDLKADLYKDIDGRLHVPLANISKCTVNPYWGFEIPDSEKLGLDQEKRYMLLRDADELQAGINTFNGLQILAKHVPVSAEDRDSHHPTITVGATGRDARYSHPHLQNSLVIWDKEAIDDIESGKKRELSCAYRYTPVLRSGTYEGVDYQIVMTKLAGNHVALVEQGRAGPDCVIGEA
jgi:hypothetical protein